MSIQALPPEVIAQIKSSITITSLNGVVYELLKNAMDASATKIDGTLDYARGGCVLEDDGLGIHPSDFSENGGLGTLYYTSKLNSQGPVHGGRGIFLASLSAVAVTTITSHHHSHRSHNTLCMHKSEVASRQTPAPAQQHLQCSNHGTRVTVRDLFGNMPVRVKQRAILSERQRGNVKDWEELKREIVGILLSWPKHVTINIRDLETGQKLVIRPPVRFDEANTIDTINVPRICSILAQAVFISPEEKAAWIPVSIKMSDLAISGSMSLQPSPTKNIQFISIGIHNIGVAEGQRMIYEEINRLFANSAFGNEEEMSDLDEVEKARRAKDRRYKSDGFTNKELKGERKGVDRWPMFYINIQQLDVQPLTEQMDPDGILDSTSRLSKMVELLRTMITQFLTVHNFRPKAGHRRPRQKAGGNAIAIELDTQGRVKKPTQQAATAPPLKSALKTSTKIFDPLGSNVRLPSFQRSLSKPECPFESWSKIKSGAVANRTKEKQTANALVHGISNPRPASAPPPLRVPASSATTPLFAKDGKLTRRPFDDVPVRKLSTKGNLEPEASTRSASMAASIADDAMVEWVNPISKVKSMVNVRTGLTVAAKHEVPRDISLHRLLRPPSGLPSKESHSQPNVKRAKWIDEMLQRWENPTFQLVEQAIPQIAPAGSDEQTHNILHGRHHHCSQIDMDRAFRKSSAAVSGRISKTALKIAKIISQVDKKFILIKLNATTAKSSSDDPILVLVDQHAADERIRIESLMQELCSPPVDAPALETSPVNTTPLAKSLVYEVVPREMQLLKAHDRYFANWGIFYAVSTVKTSDPKAMYRLTVSSLPPGIIERCKEEPRLLIDLIRTEAWAAQESGRTNQQYSPSTNWLHRTQSCPQGIIDMLNSRACRGAIMFNDELSREQCEMLITKLAKCMFPFQCAHGRPSLVPLVDLEGWKSLDSRSDLVMKEQGRVLGRASRCGG